MCNNWRERDQLAKRKSLWEKSMSHNPREVPMLGSVSRGRPWAAQSSVWPAKCTLQSNNPLGDSCC